MIHILSAYAIYGLCGVFLGGTFSILFFQMNKEWVKILVALISVISAGAATTFSLKYDLLPVEMNMKLEATAFFLIAAFSGVIISMILLARLLKRQDKTNTMRFIDIVFGFQNHLEEYYRMRKAEIDKIIDKNDIKNLQKDLKKQKKELDRQCEILEAEKIKIEHERRSVKNQANLCIKLPINNNVPVSKKFIEILPYYVNDYASYACAIRDITVEFLNNTEEHNIKELITGYFIGLCMITLEHLFGRNVQGARVHFRYLDRNKYVQLAVSDDGLQRKDELTIIDKDTVNLITKSFEERQSLLKSENPKFKFDGKNHSLYKDYLTIAFYAFEKDGYPFLSMGISVKDPNRYREILQFLNYCKIEEIVQNNICLFNKKHDIIKILNTETVGDYNE